MKFLWGKIKRSEKPILFINLFNNYNVTSITYFWRGILNLFWAYDIQHTYTPAHVQYIISLSYM